MKRSYLLVCLLLNIFVGSAKTIPSFSNMKFGFINEKVSRTFYNSYDTVFNPNIKKNNINSTPPCNTASISYAGTPFCTSLTTGQNVTLTGTGTYTGGTYSAQTGLALNAATGAIIPSQSTPGTYTVSYTVSGGTGCPTVVATFNVVIVSQTTVAISYAGTPFCSSLSSGQAVTRSGTGGFGEGSYSGTSGLSIDPFSGVIFPSKSTTGSHTVTYTIPAIGGCAPVVATTTIVVNPKPIVANQNITVCSDIALGINLNSSTSVAAATYTITNINSNGVVPSAGNPFIGSGLLANVIANDAWTNTTNSPINVIYTVIPVSALGCQGNSFTVTVTVYPIPVAVANATATTICSSSTTNISLSSTVPGTTFSWYTQQTNVTGSAGQGSGNAIFQTLTNLTNLPQTIVYTITPFANGCSGMPINVTITVNPRAVIEGINSACVNGTSQLISSGSTLNFPWDSSNTAVATVDAATGLVRAFSAGTCTIFYNTSNASTCQAQKIFTVYPTPVIPNQTRTICSGSEFFVSPVNALPTTVVPDGTMYTWTVTANKNITGQSNQSVAQDFIFGYLSNLTNVTQTVVYTVTPRIGGCVGAPFTVTIIVNPSQIVFNQSIIVCSDVALGVNLNSSTSVAAATYTITNINSNGVVPSAGNPFVGSGLLANVIADDAWANTTPAAVNVVYTVVPVSTGGCEGNPFTVTITVESELVISNQITVVCSDTNNGLILGTAPNTTYYITNINSNGLTASAGNPTTGIGLAANEIANDAWTNTTTSPINVIYTVIPVSALGCQGNPFTVTVTVYPIPVAVANATATTICSSSTTNITLSSIDPETNFTWNAVQTNVTGASPGDWGPINQTLYAIGNTPGSVVYTITPFSNGCSGLPINVTITVNPRAVIEGINSACINGTSQLFGSGTPATSNLWTSNNPAVATVSNTGLVTAVSSGVTEVTYRTSNATACSNTIVFTVYPTPVIPNQTQTICSGTEFLVSPVNALPTTVVPDGTMYTWTVTANKNITGQSNQSVAQDFIFGYLSNLTNVTQTVVYTVTPRIGGCVGAPFTLTVTVNPKPVIFQVSTVSMCSGTAFTLTPVNAAPTTIVPKGTTYSWTVAANPNVSGQSNQSVGQSSVSQTLTNLTNLLQTVVYTVTPTYGSTVSCVGASFTVTVMVNPSPIITSQPLESQTVCLNSNPSILSVRLSNGAGSPIYQWYYNTTYSNIGGIAISGGTDSSYIPPTFQVGTYYYYCIVSYNSGFCGNLVSSIVAQVIINPIPVAVATATANTICSSSTTNISLSSSVPGTNFSWYNDQTNVTGSTKGSGNTINQTLIATVKTPGSVVYTITPFSNGCSGLPINVTITVNPRAVIEGINSACINGTSQLFGSGTPATSNLWTSNNPAVATVSNTGLVTAVSSGVTEVTYRTSNATACSNTIVFTVYPTPVIPNQTQTICSGTEFLVSPVNALPTTVVPDGTRYTWTVTANQNITGQSNQSVAQDFIFGYLSNLTNVTQTVVYTVTPRIGGCAGAPFTVTIIVNPRAVIPEQSSNICSGTAFTVIPTNANQAIVPFGTTYVWTVASNSNVTGQSNQATGQTNISQILTNYTNTVQTVFFTVTPVSGNCVVTTFTIAVTVNPVPAIQNRTATICSGTAFTVTPFNAAPSAIVPKGTKYTWTVAANPNVTGQSNQSVGQNSISQTLTNLTNLLQTVVYTVTPTYGSTVSCVGASFTVTVMVNPTTCSGFHLNAFLDSNNNGTQDVGEINFPFGQFIYQVNNVTHNIATLSGMYDIYESTNNNIYTLRYAILPQLSSYFTVSPSTYTNVQINSNGGITTYNFPITMNPLNDLGITIIPYGRPVPGFSFLNLIMYTNYGSATASGTITFTKNPLLSIVSTSEPTATINSSGFTYNFTNLNRYQSKFLFFRMNTPTIPTVNLGQWLCNTATIAPSTGVDIYPRNNTSTLCSMVTGSYDPNDIVESHGREIVHADFTSQDYLYYTIRFENTGNGNAVNIKVANTLNIKLDETTMEMVSSSHDYAMDRVGTGVNWNFSNIQLPPSVDNTTTGKGYIIYRIKPKAGYAVGDIVPNTASIYFDFNPAIITNTFENQFVSTFETVNLENNEFSIYPNPAKDQITIDLGNNSKAIGWSYKIVNTLGQEVLNGDLNSQQNTIQLSNIKGQGVYFVKIYDSSNNLFHTKKIIIKQ